MSSRDEATVCAREVDRGDRRAMTRRLDDLTRRLLERNNVRRQRDAYRKALERIRDHKGDVVELFGIARNALETK